MREQFRWHARAVNELTSGELRPTLFDRHTEDILGIPEAGSATVARTWLDGSFTLLSGFLHPKAG